MAEFKRVINVIPLTRLGLARSQIFTYLVPPDLYGHVRPGQLVSIPFQSRTLFGLISSVEMHRLKSEVKGLKSLKSVVSTVPMMSEKNLAIVNWLSEYYACPMGVAAKVMLPRPVKSAVAPKVVGHEQFNPDFVLSEAQRLALNQIAGFLNAKSEFLLQGPRGSGKTEVCLQIISRVLKAGRQAIVLVPEVGRVAAFFELLSKRFGVGTIALLHSQLTDSERLWEWQKTASTEKSIVLGTRSAVFAPVKSLGVVVVSDEHHSSYKQYDQQPKYDARRVASKLSRIWKCPVVYSSATPSVELYYRMTRSAGALLSLPNRIKADQAEPRFRIVPVTAEVTRGLAPVLSPALQVELTQVLLRQKPALLVFNRFQAGRLTDELHELLLTEFRGRKPEVIRQTAEEILLDPAHGQFPPALIGVVDADSYLRLPDFRAQERTYQYLHAFADRLGTRSNLGALVLQTAFSAHYAMQAVRLRIYERFFDPEIRERKKAMLPPFARLVKLSARSPESLKKYGKPEEAFFKKARYPWQVVLKYNPDKPANHAELFKELPAGVDIDVDPESLL